MLSTLAIVALGVVAVAFDSRLGDRVWASLVSRLADRAALESAAEETTARLIEITGGPAVGDRFESEPDSPGADWILNQRTNGQGSIPRGAYRRALDRAIALEARTESVAPEIAAAEWDLMGPTNIGGRIADLVIDPVLPDTVYAATASGGVWKSTDAGMNWSYSWSGDETQSLGALAVGSDGVLYAGTGEASPGGGSITYGGTGLFRSSDHGVTWELIGLPHSGAFGRIVVDTADPDRIFAAASGDLYRPGGQRGLYLSEDGGETWERILAGENETTGAADVALDPSNPDHILVTMWDHQRLSSHRVYAGEGSGLFRSLDGGETWTEIELPHGLAANEIGRIGVAFAPSDPDRVYSIIGNRRNGTAVGFFRSEDGGATFVKTPASVNSLSQSSFGWWFGRVWVDPDEPARVFVPGVNLQRSTNGGDSFSNGGSGVHADQHGMMWDPKVEGRVYLGNDGGMYRSDDDGATWEEAVSQGWTQHYSVDVGELTPDHVVSGLQDNGCIKNWSGSDPVDLDTWGSFGLCGDGLETLINPTHERTLYSCSQYGSCSTSLDGAPAGVPMSTTNDRRGWWTPIVFDPTSSFTMYFGGNRVNQSLNGGLTWTAISPDLTRNEPQLDEHSGYKIRHVITTIAVAAADPATVWVGTDDGLLWRSTDATAGPVATWTPISSTELPDGAWVTRVTIDPADEDVVYVTYSGYRSGEDAPHVLKTIDGGATWVDVSKDLPDAPVNDLVFAGDRRIVATDVGVFVTEDDDKWFKLGSNLPAVPIIELRYHAGTNTITAATFGHGIQRVVLP